MDQAPANNTDSKNPQASEPDSNIDPFTGEVLSTPGAAAAPSAPPVPTNSVSSASEAPSSPTSSSSLASAISSAPASPTIPTPSEAIDPANAARLGEILLKKGLVSKDQLSIAQLELESATGKDKMLGPIMVNLGFITESALSAILEESSGVKAVDLKAAILDPAVIRTIPKEVALKFKVLALEMHNDELKVAMSDVYNIMAIDQLRRHFSRTTKITSIYAAETQILEAIDQYYDYEMSVDGILKEIEATDSATSDVTTAAQLDYTHPTVRLVDAFLIDGIKQGASDLHFEPDDAFVRLRYRIDGKLRQIVSFHKRYWPAIVVRIKILSSMNISEMRHPQDGRITYQVMGREIDFRVSTMPTIHGENIVMRILDGQQSLVELSKLGFSEHNDTLLKKLLHRPEGIIIVTGPTGSGKTTTLYSILNYINSIEHNIMTLENPVEYQLSLIRQSNIREGTGFDFTDGIRSLMRQDPDIIFVGEVRDEDTATMALRAAMTGHQVFTTLHTNDAIGAIPRLVDIGVPPTMLAGSLICIIAQRLLRKLCVHCKKESTPDEKECKILGVSPSSPPKIFRMQGCEQCHGTGYKGRVAVCEILPIDRTMDEMIAISATRKTIWDYAVSQGYQSMLDDGVRKVLEGITDVNGLMETLDVTSRL